MYDSDIRAIPTDDAVNEPTLLPPIHQLEIDIALREAVRRSGGSNGHVETRTVARLYPNAPSWSDIDALSTSTPYEQGATPLAERTSLAPQHSLLLRYAPSLRSDRFRESKIDHLHLRLGLLTLGSDLRPTVERALSVRRTRPG